MSENRGRNSRRNNRYGNRPGGDFDARDNGMGRSQRRQADPDNTANYNQQNKRGSTYNNTNRRNVQGEGRVAAETAHSSVESDCLNPTAVEFKPQAVTTQLPDKSGDSEQTFTEPSKEVPENLPELKNVSLAEAASFLPEEISTDNSGYDGWEDAPITTGRLQDGRFKSSKNIPPGKQPENKSIATAPMPAKLQSNENFSNKVSNFETFLKKSSSLKGMKTFSVVDEMPGNLFEMDKSYALANCVAEDLNMGSGIAITFRQDFKGIGELLAQHPRTGGLVFLHHKGERYIYYLVTKKESIGKPTLETLFKSLEKLKEHMVENNVKLLAIPRLGCGLDRLEWSMVKVMIEYVFTGTDVTIKVCNFQQAEETMSQKKVDLQHRKCPLKNVPGPISNLTDYSIVLYIGAVDGRMDANLENLFKRWTSVKSDYQNKTRRMGENILTIVENYKYYIVGCIAKQKIKDDVVDFVHFEKCIDKVKKENDKFHKRLEHYSSVAIQTYSSAKDDLYMAKLQNMLKTYFYGVTIYIYDN